MKVNYVPKSLQCMVFSPVFYGEISLEMSDFKQNVPTATLSHLSYPHWLSLLPPTSQVTGIPDILRA